MQDRPTSVTVLAIINFVMCGFMFFGALACIAMPGFSAKLAENLPDPEAAAALQDTGMQAYMVAVGGLTCLAAIALLVGSIGLLSMKRYGWVLTVIWAFYSIVMWGVGQIMSNFVLHMPKPQNADQAFVAINTATSIMCGALCNVAYPIIVLAFLLPKSMRDRFGGNDMMSHVNPYAPPPPFTGADVPYQSPPREDNNGGWKSD